MPRGYTDITLKGGPHDGKVYSHMPLYHLPERFGVEDDKYIGFTKNGFSLYKGERSRAWLAYYADCYVKRENEKHKAGMVYDFEKTQFVLRCGAITKKGSMCKNSAIEGGRLCDIHNKQEQVEYSKYTFPTNLTPKQIQKQFRVKK